MRNQEDNRQISDTHDIRLGDVLTHRKGFKMTCVGATDSLRIDGADGKSYVFVRDTDGIKGVTSIKDKLWVNHYALTASLEANFTDADAYKRLPKK